MACPAVQPAICRNQRFRLVAKTARIVGLVGFDMLLAWTDYNGNAFDCTTDQAAKATRSHPEMAGDISRVTLNYQQFLLCISSQGQDLYSHQKLNMYILVVI